MSEKESHNETEALYESAETPYNLYASMYALSDDGVDAYKIYELEGQEYQIAEDGKVFVREFDEDSMEYKQIRIKDKAILARLRKFSEQDKAISEARGELADALSAGNLLFKQVLEMHLEYRRGHVDAHPMEKEGIKFYSVGHNASHSFYLGVKDGKVYRCSIDEWYGSIDYYDALQAGELDEKEIQNDGIYISEADPDNIGYIGHF